MKEIIMKMTICGAALLLSLTMASCEVYESPEINQGLNEENNTSLYTDAYDPISNVGQYYMPEMKVKPKKYWNCVEVVTVGSRNELGQTEKVRGLQYHLMCQSLAGLANRAVEQGTNEIAVWLHDHGGSDSYKLSKQALEDMGIHEQGMQSGLELARNDYGPSDGVTIQLKGMFDGYVLTDIEHNPESGVVASVASHVYNSIIVDVRDKEYYEEAGYTMKYDARSKTTAQAWAEFKDKCSNKALVIMPVQTGELREFAIKNELFVLNLNKRQGSSAGGQNTALLKEILAWLEPNAPVYGWEQGVSEDAFVDLVSKSGHPMIPCDWSYNHSLTSLLYSQRQKSTLARVKNPQFLDYTKKKNFVSFFLSDGDNIQWMMNDFKDFYNAAESEEVRMTYGIAASVLPMMAPAQFDNLLSQQKPNCSILEMLGGGYYYVDNYSENGDRAKNLKVVAERLSAHMRQHRVKLLGVMAMNVKSEAAKEAFQAYVDANDQLEGIVALQYSPYAGGEGDIIWVTNKAGYDIPAITVKYSLWNFGNRNAEREGTPAYIAGRLKQEAQQESFSVVCVHAWSNFSDHGQTEDPLIENQSGDIRGAGAAKLCAGHLNDSFEVVNMQELVWRLRMSQRPEQTKKYLSEVF